MNHTSIAILPHLPRCDEPPKKVLNVLGSGGLAVVGLNSFLGEDDRMKSATQCEADRTMSERCLQQIRNGEQGFHTRLRPNRGYATGSFIERRNIHRSFRSKVLISCQPSHQLYRMASHGANSALATEQSFPLSLVKRELVFDLTPIWHSGLVFWNKTGGPQWENDSRLFLYDGRKGCEGRFNPFVRGIEIGRKWVWRRFSSFWRGSGYPSQPLKCKTYHLAIRPRATPLSHVLPQITTSKNRSNPSDRLSKWF